MLGGKSDKTRSARAVRIEQAELFGDFEMYQVQVIDGETGVILQRIDCQTMEQAKREDAAQTTQLARTGHYSVIVEVD
jgi:hypothetical protein